MDAFEGIDTQKLLKQLSEQQEEKMNIDIDLALKKWKPIIEENYDFAEEDKTKVCEYLEFHTVLSAQTLVNGPIEFEPETESGLLYLSLKTLSKIKDLSKIEFTKAPIFVKDDEPYKTATFGINVPIKKEDILYGMSENRGIDIIKMVEEVSAVKMSEHYNNLIDKGKTPIIYLVVSSIKLITEGSHEPRLMIFSRYAMDPELETEIKII